MPSHSGDCDITPRRGNTLPRHGSDSMPTGNRDVTPKCDRDVTPAQDGSTIPHHKDKILRCEKDPKTRHRRDVTPARDDTTPGRKRDTTPYFDSGSTPRNCRDVPPTRNRDTATRRNRNRTPRRDRDKTPHRSMNTTPYPDGDDGGETSPLSELVRMPQPSKNVMPSRSMDMTLGSNVDLISNCDGDVMSYSDRVYGYEPPSEPPKAGLDEKRTRGKRSGYVGGVHDTSVELGSDENYRDGRPTRFDPASMNKWAGLSSKTIANNEVAATAICENREKPKSSRQAFTDPITHTGPDSAIVSVNDQSAGAGVSSGRLTYMRSTCITLPRGVAKAEFTPFVKTDPILHKTAIAGAGAFADFRANNQGLRHFGFTSRASQVCVSGSSKLDHLTEEELHDIARGKQVRDGTGRWSHNVAGHADMLRGGTAPYMKCEKPATDAYQLESAKRKLLAFERVENVPVNEHMELVPGNHRNRESSEFLAAMDRGGMCCRRHPGVRSIHGLATQHGEQDDEEEWEDWLGTPSSTARRAPVAQSISEASLLTSSAGGSTVGSRTTPRGTTPCGGVGGRATAAHAQLRRQGGGGCGCRRASDPSSYSSSRRSWSHSPRGSRRSTAEESSSRSFLPMRSGRSTVGGGSSVASTPVWR